MKTRNHDNYPSSTPDPLPADFSGGLREIDDRLARAARREAVPLGLADRVLRASVEYLPSPPRPRRLQPVRAAREPLWSLAWGRLALAASVVLAVGAALWLVEGPTERSNVVLVGDGGVRGALPPEVERLLMEPAAGGDSELASLLDTRDLTFDDLARELAMLVANLEM